MDILLSKAKSFGHFLVFVFTKNTIFYVERPNTQPNVAQQTNTSSEVELTDLSLPQDGQDVSERLLPQDADPIQHAPRQTTFKSETKGMSHFDFLDGYRGLCALLVVIQHSVGHMQIPHDYTIVYILGSHLGVFGFFVLSAFLLTYRFIKELDTKLDEFYKSVNHTYVVLNQEEDDENDSVPIEMDEAMPTTSNLEQGVRKRVSSCLGTVTSQLKIFTLVTLKYALRRFFRIYVSLLVFTWDRRTIFLQNLGMNHLWTMPTEIKYYFCIPLVSLVAVKTKRFALVWFILGFCLVLLNERFQVLPFEEGFTKPMGGTLVSYFTVFFSGSLVSIVYYFQYESPQKTYLLGRLWSKLPSFGCAILQKQPFIVYLSKVLTKPVKNIFWSVISLSYFLILFTHYSMFWKDHSLPTDQIAIWLGLKPFRLIDHMNAGITSSFLLILMLLTAPTTFTDMFAKSSILTSYGKYSYGIYLWHIETLFKVVRKKSYFKSDGFEVLLLEVSLAYLYGFCFYYLVENPLMNIANFLSKKLDSLKCLRVK